MLNRALLLASLGALVAAASTTGCEKKAIPPRTSGEAARPQEPEIDPLTLLEGGELLFEDKFDRAAIGERWRTDHAGWRIVKGWVNDTGAKNKGLWFADELPDKVRIEFEARSEPRSGNKPFEGDLKCEVFAEQPAHQGGYILVNGGWKNSLDIIARLDEHGDDRLAQASSKVEASRAYKWTIARVADTVYWFIDGRLHMSYPDPMPVRGRYFGFNNWAANVFFDNVRVYRL